MSDPMRTVRWGGRVRTMALGQVWMCGVDVGVSWSVIRSNDPPVSMIASGCVDDEREAELLALAVAAPVADGMVVCWLCRCAVAIFALFALLLHTEVATRCKDHQRTKCLRKHIKTRKAGQSTPPVAPCAGFTLTAQDVIAADGPTAHRPGPIHADAQ